MDSAAVRRPCFIEEDDGLAFLADMEAGVSGKQCHSFVSRTLCSARSGFQNVSSAYAVASPRSSSRFYDARLYLVKPLSSLRAMPLRLAAVKSLALHPSLNIHYPATAKSLALHPSLNVRHVHYAGPPHNVFINHRGIDTKLNLSGLLFHRFSELNLRPFLDIKSMRPGEPLLEKLNEAIRGCKVGVAVFSPRYCESPYCLHELAMLRETKKRVIPIFCDVKPSQLQVVDDGNYSDMDLQRFSAALEEARDTVGLTFDTVRGDWSKLLKDASDAVIRNVVEVDQEVEVSSTQ